MHRLASAVALAAALALLAGGAARTNAGQGAARSAVAFSVSWEARRPMVDGRALRPYLPAGAPDPSRAEVAAASRAAALRATLLARERRRAAAVVAAALEVQRRARAVIAPPPQAPSGPIDWYAIARCESGLHWSYNGPSGFDGGLQFLPSTWLSAGGARYAPYAWQATPAQQIAVASTLPLSNWPVCGKYG